MLHSLDLEKKRHDLACTLSGGMKRKLSIATAFVGQAKVNKVVTLRAGFFFGRFKKTELPKKLSAKKTEAFLPKKLRVPEGF